MAGSLTIGGMADGLLIGNVTIGPSTITGKAQISEIINCELTANTDFVVKVPTEAVAFAVIFTYTGESPGEVKFRTNLDIGDAGIPVPSQGFAALGIYSGVTELKFKSTSPPPVFQLVFV